MAATNGAVLAEMQGSSLQNAFAQAGGQGQGVGPQNLDILQIVIPGSMMYDGSISVAVNVDYTGAVHNPAVSPTNGTRLGVFESNLASSATTAQHFAAAFTNPSLQDILQVINFGGNISYWLDSKGVAHGS
jgi:hypothetical protein